MKRAFGTRFLRLMRGGQVLTDAEAFLVNSLVQQLPPDLREVVSTQFDEYNLAQREVDGRALNFYRAASWRGGQLEPSRRLSLKADSVLVRISATLQGQAETLHATLHAVSGRAFCVKFSRAVPKDASGDSIAIIEVTHAGRSNVTDQDVA